MKKNTEFQIISNHKVNKSNIYELVLKGDTEGIKPGQFVNIKIPNKYLPRPFSVAYHDDKNLYIVYRVVGEGTEILSNLKENDTLKVLTNLGNGFDLNVDTKSPLLVGGGTGVAPIYDLASNFSNKGIEPKVLLGFRNKEDAFYLDKFDHITHSYIAYETNTDYKYPTDYIRKFNDLNINYDYFYACGPKLMLKGVSEIALSDGEVSIEGRMACGIGQCKCCSIETAEGMKTICKNGPVLKKDLVKW